jgi:hypothetical protein
MNSNRCFRVAAAALAVLLVASAALPAGALSVASEDVPGEAQVGTQIDASVTLNELYQNPQAESWQLSGETELTDVTWTVVYYDQTGAQTGISEYTGQSLSGVPVDSADDVSEVEVRITGTVPEVSNYSYDPEQQFLLMELTRGQEGGASSTIDAWQTHHYTETSRSARQAIDEAATAIDEAQSSGADTSEAETDFGNAVEAYNDGSFDVATNLAQGATESANQAQQSSQTQQTMIYAGIGVVVLLVLGGVVYWWQSREEHEDRLG